MKIEIEKTELGRAADMLGRVIASKNVLPILGDIRCIVNGTEMEMTASDGEVELSTTVPLTLAEGDGSFCVPAQQLQASIQHLAELPVVIIADAENLPDAYFRLKHKSGTVKFRLDDAAQYPQMAGMGEVLADIRLKSQQLREAIRRTAWCCATDQLRPVMTGVYVQVALGGMTVVGSDGHTLVTSFYPDCGSSKDVDAGLIIPRKVAALMTGILTGTGEVRLLWDGKHAQLEGEGFRMRFTLQEGKYPNFKKVIPSETTIHATLAAADLQQSLKKVLPFGLNTSYGTTVALDFADKELKVSTNDADFDRQASDTLAIGYQAEKPLRIGVNGQRLEALLSHLGSQSVSLKMIDAERPIVVCPEPQAADCEVISIQMPVKFPDAE